MTKYLLPVSVFHLNPPFSLLQGPTVQFERTPPPATVSSARHATEAANLHIIVLMMNAVLHPKFYPSHLIYQYPCVWFQFHNVAVSIHDNSSIMLQLEHKYIEFAEIVSAINSTETAVNLNNINFRHVGADNKPKTDLEKPT